MSDQEAPSRLPYVLGIDLGAQSVGWAVLDLADGGPCGLRAMGSRVFEAGVTGSAGEIESGMDKSRAEARRTARLARRQTFRRMQRRRKLLRLLMESGLLPPGPRKPSLQVDEYFQRFDDELRERHLSAGTRLDHLLLFYRLRAKALDEALPVYDFGRILYQLGQRRGFKTNRRAEPKKDEKPGEVATGIQTLGEHMAQTGARTLGEYLAGLDPEEERIRRRWTSRGMYEWEFAALWTSQARFHPELNEQLRKQVYTAMFFQRPLRSQKDLVGECPLIRHRKRCPVASRIAQRFRLLQRLNDLRITPPRGEERALEPEERTAVLAALLGHGDQLDKNGNLTFAKLRSLLGLPRNTGFNLQRGEETKLPGHRTDHKLRQIFGSRWDDLSEAERDGVVDTLAGIEEPRHVERFARQRWGLTAEVAATLASTTLEPGYAAYSRAALKKLVPRLEDGTPFASAKDQLVKEGVFRDQGWTGDPMPRLPVVTQFLRELRNPAVRRALVELRKVVNSLVAKWGVPDRIHLEMARDLKMPRDQRQRHSRVIRSREKDRLVAEKEICKLTGRDRANRRDIEKYMLWQECGGRCPYTGACISPADLFGPAPQFDIEHIWPWPRSLDDSFLNKTLCEVKENRVRKGNKTPFEAYRADEDVWAVILKRVEEFQGAARDEKLRRFRAAEIPEGFSSRHLNDTRYAARLAARLLSTLYGGLCDESGRKRIQVSAGGVTAALRGEHKLNEILGDGGEKSREDHRHHAIDAVAIGLTSDAMVKALADAAERAPAERRRRFAKLDQPWPGFLDNVRHEVGLINVSHKPARRISGALHLDSNLSPGIPTPAGVKHRKRVALEGMTIGQVEQIADPAVRALVQGKLEELRSKDPKRTFSVQANLPRVQLPDGREVRIKAARIDVPEKVLKIGRLGNERHVLSGSNHHMAVVAVLDAEGKTKSWEGHVVSLFEAVQRKRRGDSVVQKEWGEGRRFVCSLALGDSFQLPNGSGAWDLCRVRSVWVERSGSARMEYVRHTEARQKAESKKAGAYGKKSLKELMEKGLRKVSVNPLGQVFLAGD